MCVSRKNEGNKGRRKKKEEVEREGRGRDRERERGSDYRLLNCSTFAQIKLNYVILFYVILSLSQK